MFGEKTSWRDPKVTIMLVVVLALGAIVVVSIIRDRIVNYPGWQINVTGQGRLTYQPDIANVNLGVQVDKAAKAEDALKQLNDKMNRVISEVKKTGVANEDIVTQNYTLSPHYDTKDNVTSVTGYDANQILVVKIRDIKEKADLITKVVSAATKAGVNQINGVTFEYSLLNDLKQEARVKAIMDAQKKKDEIAQALGVDLGKVVGWWENMVSPLENQISYKGDIGGGMGGGGGNVGSPNIPVGSQELVIEVNVSYKIK